MKIRLYRKWLFMDAEFHERTNRRGNIYYIYRPVWLPSKPTVAFSPLKTELYILPNHFLFDMHLIAAMLSFHLFRFHRAYLALSWLSQLLVCSWGGLAARCSAQNMLYSSNKSIVKCLTTTALHGFILALQTKRTLTSSFIYV